MTPEQLARIKLILREGDIPFFSDEEIQEVFTSCGGDFNNTIYYCCIIKSEDTTLQTSGLSLPDSSRYFLRLAQRYRPNNSGILGGN